MSSRRRRARPIWPMLAAALVVACEGQVSDVAEGFCTAAALPPGGITAVDTSVTPRANRAAEVLALEASGEFIAPTALYERVAEDLGALQAGWPDQVHVNVLGCGVPTDLMVGFTEAGAAQFNSGQYTAWDEYNETLRLVDTNSHLGGRFVNLQFEGIYNLAALAHAYGGLPEISSAEPNGYVGDGADVCLERRGEDLGTHVYIFYTGSGDCPSGCIEKHYAGFVVDPSGDVTFLGVHDRGRPEPDWYAGAVQCRAFLHGFHGV